MYLVSGKRCLAKAKTATARRTLDPLYQQQLSFSVLYQGCVLQVYNENKNQLIFETRLILLRMLQVTVWGDYGRIEGRKVFMGVAQILLDDLDLSNIVIGWYKLFGTASLVSLPPTQPGSTSSTSTSGGTATTATTTPSSSSQQQSSSSKNLKNRSGQHSFDSVG